MTTKERDKLASKMLWIIPAMILFLISDYCLGIEPADSNTVSGIVSTGWMNFAGWRIAVSNICGVVGTGFFAAAAVAFIKYLKDKSARCGSAWDRRFIKLYTAGLICACLSALYYRLASGMMIQSFDAAWQAAGGNTEAAVSAWERVNLIQSIPYFFTLAVVEITVSFGWIALVFKGALPLKKICFLAAPLPAAGVGILLDSLITLPFDGVATGFESIGWLVMFLCARRAVQRDPMK